MGWQRPGVKPLQTEERSGQTATPRGCKRRSFYAESRREHGSTDPLSDTLSHQPWERIRSCRVKPPSLRDFVITALGNKHSSLYQTVSMVLLMCHPKGGAEEEGWAEAAALPK